MSALLVIAKEPRPGRVKTRLCPPCDSEQAAGLADASLRDTLSAARAATASRRVLIFDGDASRYRDGFEVIAQGGGDLASRLASGFAAIGSPAFLIGMDTPQITAVELERAMDELDRPGCGAVLGPTLDGGYWGIGLRRPERAAFEGVPMSSSTTFEAQLDALHALGLSVRILPTLRDVDLFEDALAVAQTIPGSNFGRCVRKVAERLMPA